MIDTIREELGGGQGRCHEFEGGGLMHWKVGGQCSIETLTFKKRWRCMTPPPPPVLMMVPLMGGGGVYYISKQLMLINFIKFIRFSRQYKNSPIGAFHTIMSNKL